MSTRKLTKAQLSAELAQVTQERDDALIALDTARRTLAAYEAQQPAPRLPFVPRPQPKLVELRREPTQQGELLRAGENLYRATITPRADGQGYQVVAPKPNGKPLLTSLSPAGIGYLPEHVLVNLVKA